MNGWYAANMIRMAMMKMVIVKMRIIRDNMTNASIKWGGQRKKRLMRMSRQMCTALLRK